jgi:predicted Zn-dependent peptidase
MTVLTHTFPNGFRVVYEKPMNDIPITAAYVFCDIGSIHEHDGIRGASHFIEHMCFKGTSKIPDSNNIFIEYAKIGAYFNAFTVKRYTCYTIKCQDDYLQHSLEIISDMLMHSLFNKKEFEKEHKVVVQENVNSSNDPDSITADEMDNMLYKGSSYQFPVDDLTYHTRDTLSYADVVNFYHAFYHPSNMVLSIVSHLSFETIKKMIYSTSFTKKIKIVPPLIMPNVNHGVALQHAIEYKMVEKKGITNAHISIGFRVCGRDSPDKYILRILSKIMGTGFTGRLMKILREKHGLVYSAYCDTTFYEHTGDFLFNTKTEINNLLPRGKRLGVLPLLIKVINDMMRNGVTEDEIKVAKGHFKGTALMSLEDISNQTKYNGEGLLISQCEEKVVPYSQIYETFIEKITRKDIVEVIERYFSRKNMCVCLLSEKLPSIETIRRECEKIII